MGATDALGLTIHVKWTPALDSVVKTESLGNQGNVYFGTRNVTNQLKRFLIGQARSETV